jgi:glyoxylase-like metal-dependent hydrolase (beta-lactamase superfamily II)
MSRDARRRCFIKVQIIPVTEGIWCFRRASYFACSYLVSTPAAAFAIDVGMDSDAHDFLEGLAALTIPPSRLKAVLLTHWHNDHSAGAAFLKRELGISVYYAAAEEPFLSRRSASHGIRAWLGKRIPEEGVLVLLRGLLEEAAPEAVSATGFVADGEIVENDFRVVATPGHTGGHVAYFHQPTRALFCGDALAVVANELRLMCRPVTPDVPTARASALRCLEEDSAFICPGHRNPLIENVTRERQRLQTYLKNGGRWPLLG